VGHLHSGHSVALGLTVAALAVVPFGVWQSGSALLDPQMLLFGLGVAVVSSAIPISLEMMAMKRLSREAFGVMTSLEPAVAALLGFAILNEALSRLQWIAIFATMLAAAGSSATSNKLQARSEPADVVT